MLGGLIISTGVNLIGQSAERVMFAGQVGKLSLVAHHWTFPGTTYRVFCTNLI